VARPELSIGTWGKIRTEKLGPNRFCARARFRDYDGRTRDIEAAGTTGPAAIRALKEKLRDRAIPNDDEITRETYVSTLANLWIEEITAEERVTPQTINNYKTSLRTAILPALGNLRIREASVGRLDKFLREVAKTRPSAAKNAKVPHTFRKTVATLIDEEADTDSAAAQLGHRSKAITKKHYIVKPALAPDSSHILERLGASPTTTGPERPGPWAVPGSVDTHE
jgi:integrase